MNSNFRRDYLYKFKNNGNANGITQDTYLRYLKFDKVKKEYIFLEGATRTNTEIEFRVRQQKAHVMLSRIRKLHRIGYEETDFYLTKTHLYEKSQASKPSKRPTLKLASEVITRKTIKKFSDLEVGKKYLFKKGTSKVAFLRTDLALELKNIENKGVNVAHFEANGLRQSLCESWLDSGEMVAELVG